MKTRQEVQDLALEALLPCYRGTVALGTGVGKTLTALKHMNHNLSSSTRFLIVAPKLSIFQSWEDDINKFNMEHLRPLIEYSTYLSLGELDPTKYSIIYMDEVHSILEHHSEWLDKYSGKIIGLTGSSPHERSEKGTMISKYCPIVYDYSVDEAIEDDILNDYRIIVHTLNLSPIKDIKVERGGKTWYTSERDSYSYWNTRLDSATSQKDLNMLRIMRMTALKGFKGKEILAKQLLTDAQEKCLVFANTQVQADRICKWSYHSKNPKSAQNLEDFKSGKITMLSAVEQLSEGINIPHLKEIVIMHSFSGSSPKSQQKIGRSLRLNVLETAIIHILVYANTVDVKWATEACSKFNKTKITWLNPI